jgi:recombination protein RecA
MVMNKNIEALLKKVNEKLGTDVLQTGEQAAAYDLLDTPFVTLNESIGGLPLGKFTTVAGPQHSGKGAFCLQVIAHHMAKDPEFRVLWLDAENALDLTWAEKLGVDLERLIVLKYTRKMDTMERLLDTALSLIKETNLINMWIIDSISALVPKADIYDSKDKEKSLEQANMLNLQRKLGEFFRKANPIISPDKQEGYKGCAVVSIGQIYHAPTAQGIALEVVRGGNAFAHWAHLRLNFRRGPKSDWPDQIDTIGIDGVKRKIYPGWAGRIKIDKTRINGNEGQEVLLTFMLGRGFDSKSAAINAAFGLNIIERAGPTYKNSLLPDGKLVGKENVIKFFMDNEDKFHELEELINQKAIEAHIQEENQSKQEEKSEDD